MAQKDDVEEATGGGKKTLVLIILGAVLLVAVAVGATLFLVNGDGSAEVEPAEQVVKPRKPYYVVLKPAFTVNLAPEDPVGYLQVSLQVLTFDADVAAGVEKHGPLIRNDLMVLFAKQKSADLRSPEGKEALQLAVLETVQKIIDERGGGGEVDNVYFTDFVMQ